MYSIKHIEKETNISKETLRIWEIRYGFPMPARSENGKRLYDNETLQRLKRIKKLLDEGFRPGEIVNKSQKDLDLLLPPLSNLQNRENDHEFQEIVLAIIRKLDAIALNRYFEKKIKKLGIKNFLIDLLPLMNEWVGMEWEKGDLDIHSEHFYTEQVKMMLNRINDNKKINDPQIILATPTSEEHALGLMIFQSLLTISGVGSLFLGTNLPVEEIISAANKRGIRKIGLSVSEHSSRKIVNELIDKIYCLGDGMEFFIGGKGVVHRKRKHGRINFIHDFLKIDQVVESLKRS